LNSVFTMGKKRKELELNEKMLMQMDWTPDLKLACYELQQIRPLADSDIIRETASVLEDILQTVEGRLQNYPFSSFATNQRNNQRLRPSERSETKEQVAALKRQRQEEAMRVREEHER